MMIQAVAMRIVDVLKINLVLVGVRLLSTQEERNSFEKAVGAEVSSPPEIGIGIGIEITAPVGVNAPTNIPAPEPPSILILNRERITLESILDRSTINREYPSEDGLDRLSEVVELAIDRSNLLNQQLRAFGFNIEVVYELSPGETASQFMSSNIFTRNLFQEAGFQFIGGAAKLQLVRNGSLWNMSVEPRLGDAAANRIFVSLNLHKDDNKIPSRSTIRGSLKEIWNQAHSIMNRFDGEA